jgi:hypothetical protein
MARSVFLLFVSSAGLLGTMASTVDFGHRNVKLTDNGPANLLPAFGWQGNGGESIGKICPVKTAFTGQRLNDGISLSCPDDIVENGIVRKSRFLPYRILDQYRSERTPANISTIDLADGDFRAQITPQWGGKVFSFQHIPTKRDLVHTPSIIQPIRASVRNAQVDGGIEWNYAPGVLGHWAGTQDHVWAARLNTSRGDVIRIYEFDRFNETAFQVDILLLNGTLWAHPKTFNPHNHSLRGYWW